MGLQRALCKAILGLLGIIGVTSQTSDFGSVVIGVAALGSGVQVHPRPFRANTLLNYQAQFSCCMLIRSQDMQAWLFLRFLKTHNGHGVLLFFRFL